MLLPVPVKDGGGADNVFFKVQNDFGGSQKIREKFPGVRENSGTFFFVKIYTRTSHRQELFPPLKKT
jgi:hypothetical protein